MPKPPPPKKRKLESVQCFDRSNRLAPSCFEPRGKGNESLHLPIQENSNESRHLSTIGHRQRRTDRRVRFSRTSRVTVLPPREPLERERRWYSASDIADFRRRNRALAALLGATRTARLMRRVASLASGAALDASLDATGASEWEATLRGRVGAVRGMEHLLCPAVTRLLRQHKKMGARLVLEEQRRMENGTIPSDDDRATNIARVAALASSFSREWALRITSLHQEAT